MFSLLRCFITVLILSGLAAANTEAFFFTAPANTLSHNNANDTTPVVHVDSATKLSFMVPAPVSGEHSHYWISLEGVQPSEFYNARFSWSSLDPIQVIHFDPLEVETEEGTEMWLKLETKYNCYTKDQTFMESAHEVSATILVSSTTMGFVPVDLVPVVTLISTSITTSFLLYKPLHKLLVNLK